MRVAVVTGAFPPSQEPVATTVRHVVDESVRRGAERLVLAPGVGAASYRGTRVVRWRPGDTAALTRELRSFRPDLVHVADPRLLGPSALRVARQLGLPTVASQHSLGSGPVRDLRDPFAGADRVLATSLAGQQRLRASGVAAQLWRPGVDADLFGPEMRSAELVERWSKGRLLVVGHVGPVAGPNVLARLVALGRLEGVRLVLVRAGDGADRLRSRLLAAGVPRPKVLADVSGVDLAHAVASYDVLVQPRKKDLDCHAARAALASGVPVVGFAAGGLQDVVADAVNGLLADPRSRHGLRDAVALLRERPEVRRSLAERTRPSVACRTWADAVDELVEAHWQAVLTPAVTVAPSPADSSAG